MAEYTPGAHPIIARNKTEEMLLQALHNRPFEGKRVAEMIDGRASPHVYRTLERWVKDGMVECERWSFHRKSEWDKFRLLPDHLECARIATDLRAQAEDAWRQRMDAEAERARAVSQIDERMTLLAGPIPEDDLAACHTRYDAAYDSLRAWGALRSSLIRLEAACERDEWVRAEAGRWGLDVSEVLGIAAPGNVAWAGALAGVGDPLGGDA